MPLPSSKATGGMHKEQESSKGEGMNSSTRVAGPLSAGEHQKATRALRSLLVRITTVTLALTGLMGLAAFPGAAQVSAHTITSRQASVTTRTSTGMRQYVFARSTDDHLVVRWADVGTPGQTIWSPWQDLGLNSLDTAPAVTTDPNGQSSIIDGAYVQGVSVQHFTYDAQTGRVTKEPLGRVCEHSFGGFCFITGFTSAPAIVDEGAGRLEVFVLAGDHFMIHKVRTVQTNLFGIPTATWSLWSDFSTANFVGDPTALQTPGRTDVFIRSTDNHIYDKTFQNGHWTLWQDLGGLFTSGPAAMSPGNGVIKVVARNLQGGTDVTTFANGQWIFWTPLDTTDVGQDGVVPAVTVSGVPGYAYDLFFELPGGFLDVHSVTASGDAILDHFLASGGILINSTPAAVVVPF